MTTAIIVPVWGRPEITKLCFQNLSRTGCKVFVATSEQWAVNLCRSYGFHYKRIKNDPLGAKKNKLLEFALEHEWDQLLECGSDNVFDLDKLDAHLRIPVPHYGVNCQYMVDSQTGRCKFLKVGNGRMWGTGRVALREAVEKAYPLWDWKGKKYLDAQANTALDKAGYGYSVVGVPIYCGIKSRVNLHSYDRFDGKPIKKEHITRTFPELKTILQ